MKVPMKVDYGVRALVDLSQRYGRGPVQTAEIAARQGIPEPYLDQLLIILRKAGLVSSRRGPHGGHALAREPDQITMSMVMSILEESAAPIDCIHGARECPKSDRCTQQEIWRAVEEKVQQVLAATSIGHLARRQAEREAQPLSFVS